MRALDATIVRLNRLRGRVRPRRFPARNVLLLLPHCLQNHACDEPLRRGLEHCKRCGKCRMKDLRDLGEKYGVQTHVASGGRAALQRAQAPDIQAVLAVACSRELAEGIRGAWPKRVVGVINAWPHGACKDTDVDIADVESALRQIIEPEA